MSKTICISVDEWVVSEIVGKPKNKSQRIQELLIKGHMFEQHKCGKQDFISCFNSYRAEPEAVLI